MYGFLKNMRFFEPFFLLFLREKGLTYFDIGLLFSFQELAINLLEIPSGGIADLYGRKSAMLLSLSSYIISFVLFGVSSNFYILLSAVLLFAVGEAFRTGTHKAMIFDYLKHVGRTDEKIKVYGHTRSWSQKGSALSVLFAATIVFFTENYTSIFWYSIIPYIVGLWNIYTYPDYLNKKVSSKLNLKELISHLLLTVKFACKKIQLRKLLISSMLFSGQFKSVKYYLQAIIKAQVLVLPFLIDLGNEKRVAILSAIIFFFLYLLTSSASKHTHVLEKKFGSKKSITASITTFAILISIGSAIAIYFEFYLVSIIGFVALYVLQNIWRPLIVSRFDDAGVNKHQATLLSVESQTISLGVLIISPIMGYFADTIGIHSVFFVSAICLSFALLTEKFRTSPK
jgi:MFS family permease